MYNRTVLFLLMSVIIVGFARGNLGAQPPGSFIILSEVTFPIRSELRPSVVLHAFAPYEKAQMEQDLERASIQDPESDQTEKQEGDTTETNTVLIELPQEQVNEKEIRFHMFDGMIITGQLSSEILTVSTEFGTLQIPIDKVLEVNPGLNSYPQLLSNLEQLVEQLGDVDYAKRQAARKQMALMGVTIKYELERFSDGGNAERKKHLEELKAEIARTEMELENFDDAETIKPFIRGDSVRTPDFTVVGKIEQSQFELKSKYGSLTLQLRDIQRIDRQRTGSQEIRRSVVVTGNHFIDSNTMTANIKVNKGDVVTVNASGSIVMTPWGSNRSSTPNGSSTYGWFIDGKIEGGALCAKIGDSGEPIKIGSRGRFTADRSGVLKFGVAMQAGYSGGNYQYPGQYDVKITVRSGTK